MELTSFIHKQTTSALPWEKPKSQHTPPLHDTEEARVRAIELVSNTTINLYYAILSLPVAAIYLECDLDSGRARVLGAHPGHLV